MSNQQSFQRKLIYGASMVVLLVLISLISRPATTDPRNQGGWLARQRFEHGITQADLGQIDPASEAMRLSLMGMDGVAITMLWNKLNRHQRMEEWALVESTARTISHLNPHLLKVWEHQSWNMSYNVSREFDDYRQRYRWVKKGISYHMEGTLYNYDEPRMKDSIAHFFGQKFGNADEKVQYRRMFPEDDVFHEEISSYLAGTEYSLANDAEGAIEGKPDHWKVGRIWNLWAQKVLLDGRGSIGNMSHAIFHSQPVKRLMSYAENIQKEGHIGDKSSLAWQQAHGEWIDYGLMPLPTSHGIEISLVDPSEMREDALSMRDNILNLMDEFEALAGDKLEQMRQESRKELSPEALEALDTPPEERTEEQQYIASVAENQSRISLREVVKLISEPKDQLKAAALVREIEELQRLQGIMERQRSIVAYDYWEIRSRSEGEDNTIRARQLIYDARQAMRAANLVEAQEKFEEAWDVWAGIYERYPALKEDAASDDLVNAIKEYRSLLELQLGEDLPPDFPLMELLEIHDEDFEGPATGQPTPATPVESTEAETPAGDQPVEDPQPMDEEPTAPEPTDEPSAPMPEEPAEPEADATEPASSEPTPSDPAPSEPAEESQPESDEEPPAETPAETPSDDPAPEATEEPGDEEPGEEEPSEESAPEEEPGSEEEPASEDEEESDEPGEDS